METIALIRRIKQVITEKDPNHPIIKEIDKWLDENDFYKPTTGKNSMLYLGGSKDSYHCEICGCNVFQQVVDNPNKFVCNSCQATYNTAKK